MKKIFTALAFVLLVAACGGGGGKPPRNLDNACSIVSQRSGWLKSMKTVERKWGIPVHVQMATIHQESKFVSDARTPFRYAIGVIPLGRQSSAFGFSQALDATWKEYQKDQRRFSAKRDRFSDAVDFMGWYMDASADRLGISKFDARNQYLAYHEGRTGFARGSYNKKPWLIRVSASVADRADMYRNQLRQCGKA
ncbi:MAG: lytic transglycosylase [Litoreibacter sp.]|uniref:transglycosylase SLT domain-containing protein n=1 Tax=Litoreibacter sp. TaxID=1969459 RepID=UPI003298252B